MRQLGDVNPGGKIVVQVDAELEEIVPIFIEEIYDDVDAIQDVLEKRDFEAIQSLGHKMKGTAGGYEFDAIAAIGQSLETAAKFRNHWEVQKLVGELRSYLNQVEVVYG